MSDKEMTISYNSETDIVMINGVGYSGAFFRFFSYPENQGKLIKFIGMKEGGVGIELIPTRFTIEEYHEALGCVIDFVWELSHKGTSKLFLRVFDLLIGKKAFVHYGRMLKLCMDIAHRQEKEFYDAQKETAWGNE